MGDDGIEEGFGLTNRRNEFLNSKTGRALYADAEE
jgi:hypothetical protein